MRIIVTDTITGRVSVPVYHYKEIPYTQIMLEAAESKKRRYQSYLEIPCAFDIETTNIYKRSSKGHIDTDALTPYAYMYHWQFCIGFRVVFGRTWEEFTDMLRLIEKNMNLGRGLRLCVYVHNLAFEMQFMRKFLNITDSFCKEDREPLYVVHNNCIEFRCSAALSNMKLSKFCKSENATFYKLTDTYNYNKIRTSKTQLTPSEESYCYNDVRGLCECISSLMRFDTIATMPLTNTGYVRRDARNSMRKNKKNRYRFRDTALDAVEYAAMRGAFRGGDTHANARYANQLVENVTSFDITSSYPACMMMSKKYAVGKFIEIMPETFEEYWPRRSEFLFVLHISLEGLECIAEHGIPYIPLAKTTSHASDTVYDNGRVLKSSSITTWVTDIDLEIILKEYKKTKMKYGTIYMAKAGELPPEYKDVVMHYYREKTRLKGETDAESIYYYNKRKNQLNSLYGLMAMAVDKHKIKYTGDGKTGYKVTDPERTTADMLEWYYKSRNNFLPYQWSITVTSEARARLHRLMQLIGRDLVYIDTDSVKFTNYKRHRAAIEKLNEELKAEAEKCGAYAPDREGINHYMGVWEHDGDYDEFKTLGAKKYVVTIGGECFSTIAGVSKDAGQAFFTKYGLDAFRVGAVIKNSGHLVAFYNDDDIHEIEIDGVKMVTASNVALIDDAYTLGVTGDYERILRDLGNM